MRGPGASLAALRLEQVDLYLVHWPVEGLRGDTWRAMERILADGKARAIGVSNYTARHLDELLATAKVPPAVDQVEFSPFLHQRDLLEHCRRHLVPYKVPRSLRLVDEIAKTPAGKTVRRGARPAG